MNARAIRLVAVLSVATSTFGIGALAADDAVTLAWKFKKGEKINYVVEQSTTSEGQFAGQAIKNTVAQILDMQWDVESVAADGTAQMTQTVSRARLKLSQPGAPAVDYDSSSKEAPIGPAAQIGAVLKVLVGKPVKLKMSPRGTISDVTLPEGMAEEMKKAAPQGPAGAMLNEDSFKQMTGASTIEFADHAVKKGDTWQRQATLTNPVAGKQTTDTTYTYQGTEKQNGKQIDKIDLAVKTSIAPAAAGAPKIEIKDQQSEGGIDFDRTSGHVLKSHTKMKMTMTINIMGTKLDQSATAETTMRLAVAASDKPTEKDRKTN